MSDVTEVTILIDENYPPYSYAVNDEARGLYVDLLREAFKELPDYRVILKPLPWQRIKRYMQKGEGFAMFPPYYHGHDWPYLYPYSIAIFQEKVMLICPDNPSYSNREKWPNDFQKLSIGNASGYDGYGGFEFHTLVNLKKIDYVEAKGSSELLEMLIRKRLDCILMESELFDILIHEASKNNELRLLFKPNQFVKIVLTGVDNAYIGYSAKAIKLNKYPFGDDFRRKMDNAIYRLLKSELYYEIIEKYKLERYTEINN